MHNEVSGGNPVVSIDTSALATAAKQDSEAALVGAVTETAPASDTASSGLNGRLQRIAQRLTSLLALLPGSLGQKTSANSLAVVVSSDQSAVPVTGTFWQATQPVSGDFYPATQPVSGTFWQATQPVSLATAPTTPVTGTFWQATQPVSIATAPALVASSAVIGHVIVDTAPTTAVTQSGTWTVQPGNTPNTTAWLVNQSGRAKANAPSYNDHTSTSITTGAYVQLVASTSAACSAIEIFDSSGEALILATGAGASEVDQIYIFPGGNGRVPLAIAAGTRISVKAKTAATASGFLAINYYA